LESGAAFVELAISIPILVLLLAGVGDFARIFYYGIELSNAARAGAQFGAVSISNAGNPAGIKSTAVAASTNIGLAATDITPAVTCVCANDDGSSIGPTSPANNCSALAATACPTSGTHRILMVSVTASKTFNSVMRIPPIPASMALTRTAIERVSE
jgi:hypothetical protein